jgi:hypothetical protein
MKNKEAVKETTEGDCEAAQRGTSSAAYLHH